MELTRQLIFCLADSYPDKDETRTLLMRSGITIRSISFADQPDTRWTNIISQLSSTEKLDAFLSTLLQDEKMAGNTRLQRIAGEMNAACREEVMINESAPMLPASFLRQGAECARYVMKVIIHNSVGTGALLPGNWFITNHHVIRTITAARHAFIQVYYEEGLKPIMCRLAPGNSYADKAFYTSSRYDYTIVKINVNFSGGLKLATGGIKTGEHVNIIQHPEGGWKKVALRENKVVYADEHKIQYTANTMPGSSGAPIFNDQWEVVGIHRMGGELNEGVDIRCIMSDWERKKQITW